MTDRIETRTQLVEFISQSGLSYAITRACSRGAVKVLGGFSQVLPGTSFLPGWIVAITSVFGRTWYIAVYPGPDAIHFKASEIKTFDWCYYLGVTDRGTYSIYDGDSPIVACLARSANNEI